MNFFDTHCHLTDLRFSGDLDSVLSSARKAGVSRIMVPGISADSSRRAANLADREEGIYSASGIHPGEACPESFDEIPGIAENLVSAAVIAVGETGLDFSRSGLSRSLQKELFVKHIQLAWSFGLPLIIHSRDAEKEVLDILGDDPGIPVVLHCYTGPDDTAREAVEKGFYLGFTGLITYPRNGRLRDLISSLPADRILSETDSPYLAPQPVRGERNEPSNVVMVADTIGRLLNLDRPTACRILLDNALTAFQIVPRRTDLIYRYYDRLYVNITGMCTNNCLFCIRNRAEGIGGYHLKHSKEPDEKALERIVDALDPQWSEELVFCGFGEPTMRPGLLRRLAAAASRKGFRVRLNTNGLCLERLSKEETHELLEPFSQVSISLNASSRDEYDRICLPGEGSAWEKLQEFILLSRDVCSTRLTAVCYPGIDMEAVESLAQRYSLPLRKRG